MPTKKVFVIALALGDLYDNRGEGSMILPKDGAIERLEAAIKAANHHRSPSAIICTAGFSRRTPKEACDERAVSLAHQLARYVREETSYGRKAYPHPVCWGTEAEIKNGVKFILDNRFESPSHPTDQPYQVVLAIGIHPLQKLRVKMYLWRHVPKAWHVEIAVVKHRFSAWSMIREILGFPVAVKKFLFHEGDKD